MLFGYLLGASLCSSALNKQMLAVLNAIPSKTWEASGSSRVAQMSDEGFKAMLMDRKFLKTGLPVSELSASSYEGVPDEYDYRDKYQNCEGEVFDQGHCGSCWAFAATSTFSDRLCVANKTSESVGLSQEYQLACDTKDAGCDGGYLKSAWDFFRKVGVPTLECVSYASQTYHKGIVPKCPKTCDDGSNFTVFKTRRHGKNIGGDADRIKEAIYRDGPVLTGFEVYEDFKLYEGGIYKHVTGDLLGGHAVEIIGYGEEDDTDFWLVRNSWGENWGEDGFFRIVRGENECGFEEEVISGKV